MNEVTAAYQVLIVKIIFNIYVFETDFAVSITYVNFGRPVTVRSLHACAGVGDGQTRFEKVAVIAGKEGAVEQNAARGTDFELRLICGLCPDRDAKGT